MIDRPPAPMALAAAFLALFGTGAAIYVALFANQTLITGLALAGFIFTNIGLVSILLLLRGAKARTRLVIRRTPHLALPLPVPVQEAEILPWPRTATAKPAVRPAPATTTTTTGAGALALAPRRAEAMPEPRIPLPAPPQPLPDNVVPFRRNRRRRG